MGLTIHWNLKATANTDVVSVLSEIRQKVLDLPVAEVSPIVEFSGSNACFQRNNDDDPYQWLKIQAERFITKKDLNGVTSYTSESPLHFIAFSVWPGEGCEEANIGLALYPRCRLWRWNSFCKTQYAEDFLKCHLSVIKILDICKDAGILEKVNDEGEYWETRNLKILAEEINASTDMIKSLVGSLRGSILTDGSIEAPIDTCENYVEVS